MSLLYTILFVVSLIVMFGGIGMVIFHTDFGLACKIFVAGFVLTILSLAGKFTIHEHTEECTHWELSDVMEYREMEE